MSGPIFINGKFTAQRTTGVQRLARELVSALDRAIAARPRDATPAFVLLCPAEGSAPPLRHIEVRRLGSPVRSLHAWEQMALPWATRGSRLLNLAGTAPVLGGRQVCMFPDAAVFDWPGAYTPAFAAWYRFAFRVLSRTASLALTISQFSKQRLMHHLHLPEERLAVVPCSGEHILKTRADDAILARLDLSAAPFLLAVGSNNPTKNFAALIRAFKSLPAQPRVALVIVGGSNDAVFAASVAAGPDNDDRIVSAGSIDDGSLQALYRNALAFVFPSVYEGFGLPPLEAMACGCPVLVSRAASLPEVCGDAALSFDPHSDADIARAMREVIADPQLRDELRAKGNARAFSLTWERAAACLMGHLERIGWLAPAAA
jgi:glycosyltransferase involved in cell wall biosynthesis